MAVASNSQNCTPPHCLMQDNGSYNGIKKNNKLNLHFRCDYWEESARNLLYFLQTKVAKLPWPKPYHKDHSKTYQ